jgi:hypothetical protein
MRLLPGLLAMTLLASTAGAQTDPTAPPAGAKAILTLTGVGVQIYACRDSADGPAWTFVAPEAKLVDEHGAETGTHGAGPVWMLKDGSSVKGRVVATRASLDASSIPWLLLKAAETKGPGVLAGVAFIRRSETVGGKARPTGCDAGHMGAIDKVPYKAIYTFYGDAL